MCCHRTRPQQPTGAVRRVAKDGNSLRRSKIGEPGTRNSKWLNPAIDVIGRIRGYLGTVSHRMGNRFVARKALRVQACWYSGDDSQDQNDLGKQRVAESKAVVEPRAELVGANAPPPPWSSRAVKG